jgi:D-beta-D-heptose 7-phosphate kinase/D-beta-D-heptose 1-phosphate adenosyltransferase
MNSLQTTRLPNSFNVLLIGDSCTDRYNIGIVDRISPEAPVPILKIIETYDVPGMALNVDMNLKNLGINADFITNSEENIKCRYIDKRSGQHLIRIDNDPPISQWDTFCPFLPLGEYNAIVVSDYNKGFLSYENIEHIIRSASGPVFIDTKKTDLKRFSASWVYLKINESEYKNLSSIPMNLIVTLGSRGAIFKNMCCEDLFPTSSVEVVDVCGAGDTFLAALTAQFLFTNNLDNSIIFANKAAGLTVQHRGNYAPTYDEIAHARY